MEAPEFESWIDGVRDVITVKRVYGDPYVKDGLTVIPAATVRGGGGAGKGRRGDEESGSGGGLGVNARPSGAWVIKDGEVTWKPAVDVNRIILGAQMLALAVAVIGGRRGRSKHEHLMRMRRQAVGTETPARACRRRRRVAT